MLREQQLSLQQMQRPPTRELQYEAMAEVTLSDPMAGDRGRSWTSETFEYESTGSIEGETITVEEARPVASRILACFKPFVIVAILANTATIALETDFDSPLWSPINSLFNCFFFAEIALRIFVHRVMFFCGEDWVGNIFDFSLVAISVVEQMVLLLGMDKTFLSNLTLLRTLRILRVLRVFKQCGQLSQLVTGLIESMQMVIWIMLLMFMLMLISAIFLTDVVGNQYYIFRKPDLVKEYFGGVLPSLVTLFQFLTLDNWSAISREVTDTMPLLRIFFTCYIFIAGFAILSLLTGVIVDHMTEVSAAQVQQDKNEQDEELRVFVDEIKGYFAETDHLNRDDLGKFLQDKALLKTLSNYGVDLTGHTVDEVFDLLDSNGDGQIDMDKVRSGIMRLHEDEPSSKDMLRIRYAAERVAKHVEGGVAEAASLRRLHEVSEKMSSIEQKLADMKKQLSGFMEFSRAKATKRRGSIVKLFSLKSE